jgi:ribosomal protein S18 acetylase RimI-like enzyme
MFTLLLITLPWQGWRALLLTGDTLPLLIVLSIMTIAASVCGMDPTTGALLGMALLHVRRVDSAEFIIHRRAKGYVLQPLTKYQVLVNMERLLSLDSLIPNEPWGENEWLLDLPEKWEVSWVLLYDGAAIGFVVASRKGDGLHIHRLAVEGGEHRQGFGKLLMAAVAGRALKRRCFTLTTKTLATNAEALAFFHRLGFSVAGQDRDNILMNAESQHVIAQAR